MMNPAEGQNASERNNRAKSGGLAVFAFLSRSLQQIAALVITLLAARFLLPVEYGVYTLSIVFVTLIQTMTYTGFYHFIVTQKGDEDAILSTSFWMLTGLAFVGSAIFAVLSSPISWLFEAPDLALVLLLLCLLQPIAGITAWYSAVLLRRQKMTLHFAIMFSQNALALIVGAILLVTWQSIFALVAFRAVRVLSAFVLYLVFSHDRPTLRFDTKLARQALGYSASLYGSKFMNFLSRYGGDLILGLVYSTAEAGLYRFGNRVATGATDIVTQPMSNFALTQFGACNRNDKPIGHALERFVGVTVLLIGAVSAVVLVLGEAVVSAFFRPEYLAALGVTYAFAMRALFGVGLHFLTPALSALDQTKVLFYFETFLAISIITAIAVAAPFGLVTLAWAQAFTTLAASVAAFIVMRRVTDVDVSGACRAFITAAILAFIYGIFLYITWTYFISTLHLAEGLLIAIGICASFVLFLPLLAVGKKLRVFTLQVFSG